MRLTRLRLERYGCFDSADLAFSAEPGRIDLIVAPNGAGKSLLRQAFHDLLFDIPAQTPMKFRFGYPGMALHAEAVDEAGAAFSFGWARQGKPPRTASDPARYAALREQTTPRQLESLFALDTIRLRQGGLDLKGGETLAEALLSGTGELARPRRVLAEIERRRAENWGQGRSRPPLNAALSALTAARKRMRDAVERPEQRERAQRALDVQRQDEAAARAARQEAAAARQRLHRIELTRPLLHQLREAQAWLDAHPDAPALPEGLEQALADARAALATAQATLRAAETNAAAAAEALAAIPRDDAAARHRDALAALSEELGGAVDARRDIVPVTARLSEAEASIRAALHDIGATPDIAAAPALIPTVGLLAEARAAILRHASLATASTLAAGQLRAAERRLAELANSPDQAGQAPAELTALLAEIRADRDPAQHAAELARAERGAAAELTAALARVPGWSAGAEALRGLAVPQAASFQRLDAARAAAEKAHQDRAAKHAELAAKRQAGRAALAALREHPLPDDASVHAARATRDRGWRLIHARAFGPGPDLAGEHAFAGAEPLPLAFERRLREADALADRRAAELTRITEAARLQRELAALDQACAAADAGEDTARDALDRAQAEWGASMAPLGLAPDASPADVTEFLGRRAAAIDAMKADELARGEAAALRARHRLWAGRLAALLPAPEGELPALLATADAAVAREAASRKTWLDWQANHRSALREHQEAMDRADAAVRETETWRESWARILAGLARPDGEAPEATGAVLDRLAELDKHHRAALELRARVDGMQAVLDRFADTVASLAGAVDTPRAPDDFVTARALIERRNEAERAASAWTTAQQRVTQAAHVLEEARAGHAQAGLRSGAVIAAAGAVTPEEAEMRIAAARAQLHHAQARDTALAALAGHGGGLPIAALRRDAEAVGPEAMPAALQAAQEAEDAAEAKVTAAAIALRGLEDAFAAGEEETSALAASAALAAASAQYARKLEDQLVLHLAHDMLTQALDAVQAEAGEDGIARLSRAVAAVTGGAYSVALSEEDGTTLHAIEARFPGEPKTLAQLSEGTRDQLYLALRILALREHAAGAAPLPFIADDILQTFDDARAEAALRALVELSADVQVIVLTHHAHLAGVAGRLGGAVWVREIKAGGDEPSPPDPPSKMAPR